MLQTPAWLSKGGCTDLATVYQDRFSAEAAVTKGLDGLEAIH
jgi:hypothetical protein